VSAHEAEWTIRQLGEAVAGALESGYRGPANGQVRPVPDERTIRYYTSLGLIDRPLGMRGRTALYGWRHLAQIVAIKRLQEAGRTLAEIQEELSGASEAKLAQVAGVAAGKKRRGAAEARREGFWREVPEPALSGKADEVAPEAAVRPLTAVELAPGVTLLVEGVRELDAVAVRRAAAELLRELERA
jgi:DNA-binding transcriptional MerR regulator